MPASPRTRLSAAAATLSLIGALAVATAQSAQARPPELMPVFTAASPGYVAATGTPYSYTFEATAPHTPTFRLDSGALPPGLSLDDTTGILAGTPTQAGSFTFTVDAVDGSAYTASSSETIVVSQLGTDITTDETSGTLTEISPDGANLYALPATFAHFVAATIGSDGTIYVGDYNLGTVTKLPADGTAPVQIANSVGAYYLTVDQQGNVYSSDYPSNRIVEILNDGVNTQRDFGTGLSGPAGTAVDALGNLFINDTGNGRVVEVPADGGPQKTIAENLGFIFGLAVDTSGNLYVANNEQLLEIAPDGSSAPIATGFSTASGVSLDSLGNAYVSDPYNDRIIKIPADRSEQTVFVPSIAIPQANAVRVAAPTPTTVGSPTATAQVGEQYSTFTYSATSLPDEPAATFRVAAGALPPGLTLDKTTGVLSGTPTHAGTFPFTVQAGNAALGTLAPPATIRVTTQTARVAVATSARKAVHGQPVTATATVAATHGTPTGAVQFTVDRKDVGAPVTVRNGTATSPNLASWSTGAHTVLATFIPTDNSVYSVAVDTATVVVGKAASHLVLATSGSLLQALVTADAPGGGTPTGSVILRVDGRIVARMKLVDGYATINRPTDGALSAQYNGDRNFTGSSIALTIPRSQPSLVAHVSSTSPRSRYGWYRGPVTITFTCKANGADLASACPRPVTLTRNAGGQSVTRTIAAVDGGITTVTVKRINIDHGTPSVRVAGVRNGGTYAHDPAPRCVGNDHLSGVAHCTISYHRTKIGTGYLVTYRASVTDRANNHRTVVGHYTVLTRYFAGAPYRNGAFHVTLGRTYRLVVLGQKQRPVYYDAAIYPLTPTRRDQAFRPAGKGQWTQNIHMDNGLRSHRFWNVGIKVGNTMQLIKIAVD